MSQTVHTIGFPSSMSSIQALEQTCNVTLPCLGPLITRDFGVLG
jgi:hypothetical protein